MKTKDFTKKSLEKLRNSRAGKKTPRFWRRMRLAGMIIAGIGGAITAAPIAVPAAVASWATYAISIGGTMTTISQLAKEEDKD